MCPRQTLWCHTESCWVSGAHTWGSSWNLCQLWGNCRVVEMLLGNIGWADVATGAVTARVRMAGCNPQSKTSLAKEAFASSCKGFWEPEWASTHAERKILSPGKDLQYKSHRVVPLTGNPGQWGKKDIDFPLSTLQHLLPSSLGPFIPTCGKSPHNY
jgi:hypothetical protein